jgi:hypothetical protein
MFFQIMLINGKQFDGQTRHFNTHVVLQGIAGNNYWFPEFRQSRYISLHMLFDLSVVYNSRVCFNVTGSFRTFLAGLQEAFDYVMLYVAIEDIPVIRLLLQRNEEPIEHFSLGEFHLQNMAHADICEYAVFHG